MDILPIINSISIELNGTQVTIENKLSNLQLEPYALVVFFYKLNIMYPIFNITYSLTAIKDDYLIQAITDKATNELTNNL